MTCAGTSYCWLSYLGFAILWWVAASVLVFFTWNKVLATLFKLSKLKWWHPFLVIATVAMLLAPCGMRHRGGCGLGGHGGGSACAHHGGGGHGHGAHKSGACDHGEKGAKSECAGDCSGNCKGDCGGKCAGGDCEGGSCPHHGASKKAKSGK